MQDKQRFSLYLNNIESNKIITIKDLEKITKINSKIITNDLSNFDILIQILDQFNLKNIENDLKKFIEKNKFNGDPVLNNVVKTTEDLKNKIEEDLENERKEKADNKINEEHQTKFELISTDQEAYSLSLIDNDYIEKIHKTYKKKRNEKNLRRNNKNYDKELLKFIIDNFFNNEGFIKTSTKLDILSLKKLRFIINKIIKSSIIRESMMQNDKKIHS